MNEIITNRYEEYSALSNEEKERLGNIFYTRIINSMAFSFKDKNTSLTTKITNAFIRNVTRASFGPNNSQSFFIMHITGHIFDYECELYAFLEDTYESYHEELDRYLALKNKYVYEDLFSLAMLIISLNEKNKISPEEEEILSSLLI